MAGVAGVDSGRELPSLPGTYVLVFSNAESRTVRVGALGDVCIEPGFLMYVGSAFGPGGLNARISRHARRAKKHHWHIDYLRPYLMLEEAWWNTASSHREHAWAKKLAGRHEPAHARFGASDCTCPSHLFISTERPDPNIVGTATVWHP